MPEDRKLAAITRWATRMDGVLRQRVYERIPGAEAAMPSLERTGRMPPRHPGSLTGYVHRPNQFRAGVEGADGRQ